MAIGLPPGSFSVVEDALEAFARDAVESAVAWGRLRSHDGEVRVEWHGDELVFVLVPPEPQDAFPFACLFTWNGGVW